MAAKTKKCRKCGSRKRIEKFYRSPTESDGRQNWCSKCSIEYQKARRSDPKIRHRVREISRRCALRAAYGITLEDYDRMLKEQGGVCEICKKPPKQNRLNVDHNHRTGKVRGLLCSNCNITLGKVFENKAILEAAIRYLEKHS